MRHLLLLLLVLSLAACGGESESGGEVPTDAAPAAVEVRLSEFDIAIPAQVAAGSTTFEIFNDGSGLHSFVIEGEGVDQKLAEGVSAGESQSLTVDLPPGQYRVYCPIGSHAEFGMEAPLTVTQ